VRAGEVRDEHVTPGPPHIHNRSCGIGRYHLVDIPRCSGSRGSTVSINSPLMTKAKPRVSMTRMRFTSLPSEPSKPLLGDGVTSIVYELFTCGHTRSISTLRGLLAHRGRARGEDNDHCRLQSTFIQTRRARDGWQIAPSDTHGHGGGLLRRAHHAACQDKLPGQPTLAVAGSPTGMSS
jgi:hypothetical protein